MAMAMRSSAIGRVSASRIIEASRRISRSFSDKGVVLSEEEKARETIYMEGEREMLERLRLRKPPPPKPALENEKSDKKPEDHRG